MSDPQTIQALSPGQSIAATGGGSSDDRAKVKELAQQFEAMLLSKMLKSLQSSMMDGEDSEDGYKAGGLGDVMTQELSLAMSRAGGFGVGTMLTNAMDRSYLSAATNGGAIDPTVLAAASGTADDVPAVTTSNVSAMPASVPVPSPRISSAFGWRSDPIDGDSRFHKGVDLPMPVGSDVRTPADGKV